MTVKLIELIEHMVAGQLQRVRVVLKGNKFNNLILKSDHMTECPTSFIPQLQTQKLTGKNDNLLKGKSLI